MPSAPALDTEITKESVDSLVQALLNTSNDALTEKQQALLSKALFPDTHTAKVTLVGVERTLRPLTIKFARRVCDDLKDLHTKVVDATAGSPTIKVTEDMLAGFIKVAKILCEFYGWTDVLAKVEEEDIDNNDLMALAMTQNMVQGTNDFLLMPLRLLLKVAQLHEILSVQLIADSLSNTSTTRDS